MGLLEANATGKSGEDRNRTYLGPGYAEPTTVLEDREDHQAPFTLADC